MVSLCTPCQWTMSQLLMFSVLSCSVSEAALRFCPILLTLLGSAPYRQCGALLIIKKFLCISVFMHVWHYMGTWCPRQPEEAPLELKLQTAVSWELNLGPL